MQCNTPRQHGTTREATLALHQLPRQSLPGACCACSTLQPSLNSLPNTGTPPPPPPPPPKGGIHKIDRYSKFCRLGDIFHAAHQAPAQLPCAQQRGRHGVHPQAQWGLLCAHSGSRPPRPSLTLPIPPSHQSSYPVCLARGTRVRLGQPSTLSRRNMHTHWSASRRRNGACLRTLRQPRARTPRQPPTRAEPDPAAPHQGRA